MKDVLGIGEAVYELLTGDAGVTAAASGGIYPIVADEGVDFPFIIYRRAATSYAGTKDGLSDQTAEVDVSCVSDTYSGAISLALAVSGCLDGWRGTVAGYDVSGITLTSSDEDYIDNAFVQNLKFEIEL